MSKRINRVTLLGNLGRDAETFFTTSGACATKFAVATTRSWKDQSSNEWKEETNWTNVVAWRQEKLENYLAKGKQVYVEGRLQTREYDAAGIDKLAPHDLRRTCARLCHLAGGELDRSVRVVQFQALLGRALKDSDLMAKRDVFQLQSSAAFQ